MLRKSFTYKAPLVALVISAQLLLSACGGESVSAFEGNSQAGTAPAAQPVAAAPAPAPAPVQQVCTNCGTVSSIINVSSDGQASGVGAAVGALVGGLVGNQIGGGSGRRIATAAGVVGGAVAGHKIEQNRNGGTQEYDVVVTMDNGGERRIRVGNTGGLTVGSRVSVDGNTIIPR